MPKTTEPVVPAGSMAGLAQPELSSGRLVLRPWAAQDVPSLARAYADPAVRHWHRRTLTEVEARAWVVAANEQWQTETRGNWAVTRDGVVVGRVALGTTAMGEGVGTVGYWVLLEARGHGVAPAALTAVAAWATGTLGLRRLELEHSTQNLPSCRVAQKAGFALESTKVSAGVHEDGWHDMHVHVRFGAEATT